MCDCYPSIHAKIPRPKSNSCAKNTIRDGPIQPVIARLWHVLEGSGGPLAGFLEFWRAVGGIWGALESEGARERASDTEERGARSETRDEGRGRLWD